MPKVKQTTVNNVKFVALAMLYQQKLFDQLIGLHWVRALTVPTHLGLTSGPFVPHNQISARESPVPLPKFHSALRLKILIFSGSKKGTQIHFPFLSKRPGKRNPPGSPNGAPIEIPAYREFLHISKALRKERPSMFPRSRVPMETDAHSRALTYLSRFSVKMPSPEALRTEPLHREMFHSYSPFIPSLKVPGR
jgi:hypothetical protein